MSKYLGQHFLINQSAIHKIIAVLDLKKDDTVIEIGPGEGALTLPLAEKCRTLGCKIIAIEKDPELISKIYYLLSNRKNGVDVIEGDALRILPKVITRYQLLDTNYKVVGNIPYYITGKLLRILGELEKKPEIIVLTIQKEVAERVVAQPPKMNLLAAAIQIWAKAEIISNLKPQDFDPPPEVNSAIIKLIPEQKLSQNELEKYYKLIKICFKQPRKTVLNNLSTGLGMPKEGVVEILKKFGLDGTERPQNLSLSQLLQLSRELE